MFDFLTGLDADDLLAAVSYAIRCLTHLSYEKHVAAMAVAPGEFTLNQVKLGKRLVSELESAERVSISAFSEAQVRKYVNRLYEFVEQPANNEETAEVDRVLSIFSRDWPAASRREAKQG
jgi:hypothetical protein